MKWYWNKLFGVVIIGLLFMSMSATAAAGASAVLYDGDARSFTDAPNTIAYANTEHTTPPSEFQITTSGANWPSGPIWRNNQWIALMDSGSWVEAKTTVSTDTVGVQFWGDTNDGWARVLVDGSEVWTGNVYGSDNSYPGGAFVKYLEISGLASSTHTIRVENMGINGAGGGDDVTILFFGLEGASSTATPTTASGLVAYYPFDGDTNDHSGNGNDGTNNGATFVSGISGNALDFDGTNDYVYSPVNINPDAMPQVTMALWVKSDSDSRGTVISQDNGGYDRTIDIDSRGGGLGWSVFSGSGGVLGYQTVTTNKWTFLAVVYDQGAGTVKLYVDGTKYEESGSLSTGWDYTHIGSNPSFGSYFDGTIDEVRIYNYALTQSEINSLYEGETVPPAGGDITPTPTATLTSGSGLVAYYPFDRSYEDSSTYRNHGTPKGSMDFTAGVVGNAAASFDGRSYIEVKDSDSLDLTDDFTFSVWLNKKDAGVGGWAVVFSKGDTSTTSATSSPYALVHASGKYPGVRVAGQIISSNAETNFNEWYFLTVTREGSDLKFYVNGELKDTKKSTTSISKSGSKLLIGIDPPGATEYFKGTMDDLRIYNYALSQSEIRTLYGGETTPPAGDITPPSTVGFSGLIFESRGKSSGSSVQIPLTLNGVKENIGNMDITLGYDSSVLEATEVIKGGLTTNSLFDYNIVDGTIKISLADKQGFSGDGSIAYVRFDVIGAEGSSSPLEITKLSANRAEDLSVINIPAKDGVFKVVSLEESLGDVDGDGLYTAVDALYALQMAVGKIPEDLIMDMNGDGKVTSIDARKILRIAAELETI